MIYKAKIPETVTAEVVHKTKKAIDDKVIVACDYDGRDCTGLCGVANNTCPLDRVDISSPTPT